MDQTNNHKQQPVVKESLLARIKSTLIEPFSCKKSSFKWCGRKRPHNAFTIEKRGPSVIRPELFSKDNQEVPPQSSIFQQPLMRNQRGIMRGTVSNRDSLMSNRDLFDFRGEPYKRQKIDNSEISYKSHLTDQRPQYMQRQNLNQSYQGRFNDHSLLNSNQVQFQTPQDELIEHNILKVRDLKKLDDIISSKKQEIEQLEQLKEQRLLQSQVNQVHLDPSIIQRNGEDQQFNQKRDEFLRGPSSRSLHMKQLQKQAHGLPTNFNFVGMFDQPSHRQQLFNVSGISINPGNSGLNTSFDTNLSRQVNNDQFNIPLMLPRRNQNIGSSSQTKYTLDSFLEEPMPFRTHLKVSNFNLQQKNNLNNLEDHNNEELDGPTNTSILPSAWSLLDLKKPNLDDIEQLLLPNLSQREVVYINNEILNLQIRNDEELVTISEDIKLTVKDIRKLCLKGRTIDATIHKAYLKLLVDSNNKNAQIFSQHELELPQQEWQNFMQQICSNEHVVSQPQKLIFACISNDSLSKSDITSQEMIVYIIERYSLKITKFEASGYQPTEGNAKSQHYTQRVRELHQNFAQALKCSSLFSSSQAPMDSETQIEQTQIKLLDSMDQIDIGGLIYLYYLRYHAMTNSGYQWKKIEQLLRDIQYNEYFRYSIAIELVRKQLLQ